MAYSDCNSTSSTDLTTSTAYTNSACRRGQTGTKEFADTTTYGGKSTQSSGSTTSNILGVSITAANSFWCLLISCVVVEKRGFGSRISKMSKIFHDIKKIIFIKWTGMENVPQQWNTFLGC